jgi:hypothetical protein
VEKEPAIGITLVHKVADSTQNEGIKVSKSRRSGPSLAHAHGCWHAAPLHFHSRHRQAVTHAVGHRSTSTSGGFRAPPLSAGRLQRCRLVPRCATCKVGHGLHVVKPSRLLAARRESGHPPSSWVLGLRANAFSASPTTARNSSHFLTRSAVANALQDLLVVQGSHAIVL